MRKQIRAYVDTSVFGGTQDEEFRGPSRRFFEHVRQGKYVVLVSGITIRELGGAPLPVRQVLASLPAGSVARTSPEVEEEAKGLVAAYLEARILGEASEQDAFHVAIATVARADLLLSWNFRHIVNLERIHAFNGVNTLNGYPHIEIYSPLEVFYGNENEDV